MHLYKSPAFQRLEPASWGKLALLDSSPLLSLQNVPFSFFFFFGLLRHLSNRAVNTDSVFVQSFKLLRLKVHDNKC